MKCPECKVDMVTTPPEALGKEAAYYMACYTCPKCQAIQYGLPALYVGEDDDGADD